MRLRYAALSDVGRVRRDNQDAGYAGSNLLVVADGVGGSARGDIASSVTVEVLRQLDSPPGDDMLSAIAGAIHRSHDRIAGLVAESPEIDGTSTTVTAVIFNGIQLGVGHVGDSRGYLLRDGTLSQLTTDHTFVQSLIDEGRITEDEARVHPHRNLILRAVDGVHEPEPDVFMLEAALGDRILLCSDGCSGVLTDQDLARLLSDGSPDYAAVTLIRASLDAGSTDNVTVVVADLVADDAVDEPDTAAASATGPMLVGAAAQAPRRRGPGSGRSAKVTDTGELEPVSDVGGGDAEDIDPEQARYAPRAPRRGTWARRGALLALLAVLIAVIAVAGYKWSQGQYYVADEGVQVSVFKGVKADVPGVRMHRLEERSTLTLAELPTYVARQVKDGVSFGSLADARAFVSRLKRQAVCLPPSPISPSATPRASAGTSPKAPTKAQSKAQKARASAKASRAAAPTGSPSPHSSASPSGAAIPCPVSP